MIRRIAGCITAMSPLVHHGDEKTGSTPVLRSLSMWNSEYGQHVRVPFISGNAVRGILRRMVMRDMLERIGYEALSPKLHHALYTGGLLESTDEASGKLDLKLRRRVRDAVPPLALFGTAVGNQMLPGCLIVEHMMPICRETAGYMPDVADPRCEHGVRTFTDVSFATRRDDLRADRDDDEQAMQMKIEFESFIPGAGFRHGFELRHASAVETSCLGHAIDLWGEQPYIGGKSSSGYGRLQLDYAGIPDAAQYLEYLEDNGRQVELALESLVACIEPRKAQVKEGLFAEGESDDPQ